VVRAFRLVGKGRLEVSDADALLQQLASLDEESSAGDRHWIDLTDPSQDDLTRWMDAYGVPTFVRDLAVSPSSNDVLSDHSSGTLLCDEVSYFFFPVFGQEDEGLAVRLGGICTRQALVTFHKPELIVLLEMQRLAQEGDVLIEETLGAVVVALLRVAINRSVDIANKLRERVRDVSEQLARRDSVELELVLHLERQVDTLGAVVDEQLTCVRALSVGHVETLNLDGVERHFSVLTTNLETLDRALDRLDRHVESLRAQYDSQIAEHTNRRLATLTVFSAVFMPLSLIAGIYGMNFRHMPELRLPYAYPLTLAGMGGLAAALLIFFWRKGWFG